TGATSTAPAAATPSTAPTATPAPSTTPAATSPAAAGGQPSAPAPSTAAPATTPPAPSATAPSPTAPPSTASRPTKPPAAPAPQVSGPQPVPIKGVQARIAQNMDASLQVPTATSVRAVPAKLMADNRIVINNHLARGRGGKVSFTHIIGYAMVRALREQPAMNYSYTTVDGKPAVVTPEHVNLGIAIDLVRPDGTRIL